MKNKSIWCHSKYLDREYKSSYQKHAGERVFVLSCQLKNGKWHNLTFESWQMAESVGWVKVK